LVTLEAFRSVPSAGILPRWYLNSAHVAGDHGAAGEPGGVRILPGLLPGSQSALLDRPGQDHGAGTDPDRTSVHADAGVSDGRHLWGIILPQVASPIAVFVFKQFLDGIPRDLE